MGRNDKAIEQKDNDNLPLGAKMRLKRQEKKISLTDMATRLGYTKSHLSAVENGNGRPSRELVQKYEQELGVDFSDDLEEELRNKHTPISSSRQVEKNLPDGSNGHTPTRTIPFNTSGLPIWEDPYKEEPDWGESPRAGKFFGRTEELTELTQWIMKDHCQVIAILGQGGVGKTTLAVQISQKLYEAQKTVEVQESKPFSYIFWRSLLNKPSLQEILKSCISYISREGHIDLPEDVNGLMSMLMKFVQQNRCLIVLDNFESILEKQDINGSYQDKYEDYKTLITRFGEVRHNSCLLITSREKPKGLTPLEGEDSPVRVKKLSGVDTETAKKILEGRELIGTEEDWDELVRLYAGNLLYLKLIAQPILNLYGGKIADFLREGEPLLSDIRDPLDLQFKRLTDLEIEIMYWLAIEREKISLADLQKDITAYPLHSPDKSQVTEAVVSLIKRSLIEVVDEKYYNLLPVVLEFVTRDFINMVCKEIQGIKPTEPWKKKDSLLARFVLMKAQTKTYIRVFQEKFILIPIKDELLKKLGKRDCEEKLKNILENLKAKDPQEQGYTAGNILNLLITLDLDMSNYDFSELIVHQAYLQGHALPGVKFVDADLEGSVFTDIFGGVLSVALSPKGRFLAAGTVNGTIRIWHTENRIPYTILKGHTDWVGALAFNPAGDMLASASEDKTVRVWDIRTTNCVKKFEDTGRSYCVAFNQDGDTLASGGENGTISLWSIEGNPLPKLPVKHTERIWSVSFSPDGNLLASASEDKTVHVWDISDRYSSHTSEGYKLLHTLKDHTGGIHAVTFSHDGTMLASGGKDKKIHLWDVNTGELLKSLEGHTSRIYSVTFSPDGKKFASSSKDKTVRLWDVNTGKQLKTLNGHSNWVYSVAFEPDKPHLFSGSIDQTIRQWDTENGQCIRILNGYSPWIYALAVNPAGTILASGNDKNTITLWDMKHQKIIKTFDGHSNGIRSLAFNHNGTILASASEDTTIRLWNVRTGELLNILEGHNNWIYSVTFNHDGTLLASGSDDNTVRLWNVETGELLNTFIDHTNWVYSVAFNHTNNLLASSSHDGTIRLWDVKTGKCLSTYHNESKSQMIYSVAFSFDGSQLAGGCDDRNVRIWDIQTKNCTILSGHTNRVWPVAFHPKDKNILASGSDDHTVRICNLKNGTSMGEPIKHGSWVTAIAFTADGKTFVSSSYDGTIKLYDAMKLDKSEPARLIGTLENAEKPYQGMDITGARGLTSAQRDILKTLGATEEEDRRHTSLDEQTSISAENNNYAIPMP